MAKIFIVIVGFLYYGIVRVGKLSFEGRWNSWKSMLKKQEASFYRNGSPIYQKISDFWPVLYSRPSMIDSNLEGWVHWASCSRNIMPSSPVEDFAAFSPPRSVQVWAFGPMI